jgi:hypothetical protein
MSESTDGTGSGEEKARDFVYNNWNGKNESPKHTAIKMISRRAVGVPRVIAKEARGGSIDRTRSRRISTGLDGGLIHTFLKTFSGKAVALNGCHTSSTCMEYFLHFSEIVIPSLSN